MTKKPRRPGTRSGKRAESLGVTDAFEREPSPSSSERVTLPRPRPKVRLPTDVADAAEAALDDMLQEMPGTGDEDDGDDVDADLDDDEPRTQTRASSHDEAEDDAEDELLANTGPTARSSKMPLPAPPKTTSVHTLSGASPVLRNSPQPPLRTTPLSPRSPTTTTRPTPQQPPPTRAATPQPPATRAATPLPSAARAPTPQPSPSRSSPPPRPTPTPPLARSGPAVPIHTPTPTPVLPRMYTGPTLGDSPRARLEATTSDRSVATLEDSLRSLEDPTRGSIDETARVPSELPIELELGPVQVDPDELVPLRSEVASLQIAVYEESAQLGSVQSAIAAAGHVVHVVGAGRDGLQRVLAAIREGDVDVVIAALPGGEQVIAAAHAVEPRRPIVIASLARNPIESINRAHAAGADLAALKPHDVERLAPILFAASRLHMEKRVALARRGSEHAVHADELADPEPRSLLPYDVFQRVVDLEIRRAKQYEYPMSVALFAVEVAPPAPPAGVRGILRARAGNALIHSVRDIDIATQLEHERFLVLLPYTDLKGAAGLARRVINAVAKGDPVIAAGRSFPPRFVGAVAGAMPGQELSLMKLMKDATRTLEQARRDGAELAVQP